MKHEWPIGQSTTGQLAFWAYRRTHEKLENVELKISTIYFRHDVDTADSGAARGIRSDVRRAIAQGH